jgi:starch phosphorylase
MEASGTSGMKVLANGGINCSILDGWWDEAYTPSVGWAIGSGEEYDSPQDQDAIEANALFDILEKEIAPLFYDRATNGLPNGWIARMKSSMRNLCPIFNTHRMVGEYASRFYVPGIERYDRLSENGLQKASQLVDWKENVRKNWPLVKVVSVKSQLAEGSAVTVGSSVQVTAALNLAGLTPQDVYVQAHHGPLDSSRQVMSGSITNLECTGAAKDGVFTFEGTVTCQNTGLQGFSVRVVPQHPDAELPQELALIAWE